MMMTRGDCVDGMDIRADIGLGALRTEKMATSLMTKCCGGDWNNNNVHGLAVELGVARVNAAKVLCR